MWILFTVWTGWCKFWSPVFPCKNLGIAVHAYKSSAREWREVDLRACTSVRLAGKVSFGFSERSCLKNKVERPLRKISQCQLLAPSHAQSSKYTTHTQTAQKDRKEKNMGRKAEDYTQRWPLTSTCMNTHVHPPRTSSLPPPPPHRTRACAHTHAHTHIPKRQRED